MRHSTFALTLTALIVASAPVHAQDTQSAPPAPGGQSLGQAASDPTASLMSFQFNDWYTANYHNLDDETAIAGVPVQFGAQNEHDFADDEIGPANTVRFTIKLLIPR